MMLIWIKVNWIILNCEISLFKKNKFNIIYWNTDFYGCQDELTQQVVTCTKSMVETLVLSLHQMNKKYIKTVLKAPGQRRKIRVRVSSDTGLWRKYPFHDPFLAQCKIKKAHSFHCPWINWCLTPIMNGRRGKRHYPHQLRLPNTFFWIISVVLNFCT